MADLPPIQDRSYGIIALRYITSESTPHSPPTKANTQLLLINQKTISKDHPPFWCFPKGHAEASDHSTIHAAIRELEEETSLLVTPDDILKFHGVEAEAGKIEGQDAETWDGSFSERYVNPIRRVGKEVRYWVAVLARTEADKELKLQEQEVAGYKWCGWDEAVEKITFDEGRDMLKRVGALLESGGKVQHMGVKAKV